MSLTSTAEHHSEATALPRLARGGWQRSGPPGANTAFLEPLLHLPKSQLDGAFRDREQRFDPHLVVELATDPVPAG